MKHEVHSVVIIINCNDKFINSTIKDEVNEISFLFLFNVTSLLMYINIVYVFYIHFKNFWTKSKKKKKKNG